MKSLVLKYVDLLQSVEAASPVLRCPSQRALLGKQYDKSVAMAGELRANALLADKLGGVIRLFGKRTASAGGGVALLDEVDLLLHPLRSELNFPIGKKEQLDLSAPSGAQLYPRGCRWNIALLLLDAIFHTRTQRLSTTEIIPGDDALAILAALRAAVERGIESKALSRLPHLTLLQSGFYDVALHPLLSKWCAIWLVEQPVVALAVEAQRGGARAADVAAALTAYIQGSRAGTCARSLSTLLIYSFVCSFVCSYFFFAILLFAHLFLFAGNALVSQIPAGDALKVLNISRTWLTSILPHVLSKIHRVSFGLLHPEDEERWKAEEGVVGELRMPPSRRLLAIPFVGKDVPSRSSEFAHPDVLIGSSIMAFRYNGLRRSDLFNVLNVLQVSMRGEPGPYSERPSHIIFEEWKDRARRDHPDAAELNKLHLFKPRDAGQMDDAMAVLAFQPVIIAHYLTSSVFPDTMRHQLTKLQASGVDLGSDMLFGLRLGFSGTPSDLLPEELKDIKFEPGSEAQFIRVLSSPEYVSAQVLGSWTPRGILTQIAASSSEGGGAASSDAAAGSVAGAPSELPAEYAALIDTGALITGMGNEEVARFLLSAGLAHMDACVFGVLFFCWHHSFVC